MYYHLLDIADVRIMIVMIQFVAVFTQIVPFCGNKIPYRSSIMSQHFLVFVGRFTEDEDTIALHIQVVTSCTIITRSDDGAHQWRWVRNQFPCGIVIFVVAFRTSICITMGSDPDTFRMKSPFRSFVHQYFPARSSNWQSGIFDKSKERFRYWCFDSFNHSNVFWAFFSFESKSMASKSCRQNKWHPQCLYTCTFNWIYPGMM